MEENKLVLEIMHELKNSSKRWFIAFCIMIILEIGTIIGFLWYISLPVETYDIEQTVEDVEQSETTQLIGGEYNGKGQGKAESDL